MFTQRPTMRRFIPMTESEGESISSPELWDGESVHFSLNNVKLAWDTATTADVGYLYITTKRVLWIGKEKAFDFDVPYITLHAISRDLETYPVPCIYCQLDEDEQDDDEEESDENPSDLYLIPEEEADLFTIFDALSHAALLNPDPYDGEDGGDDEDGGHGMGDFIYNEEEVRLGVTTAQQQTALDHLESVFHVPIHLQQQEDVQDQQQQQEPSEEERKDQKEDEGPTGKWRRYN